LNLNLHRVLRQTLKVRPPGCQIASGGHRDEDTEILSREPWKQMGVYFLRIVLAQTEGGRPGSKRNRGFEQRRRMRERRIVKTPRALSGLLFLTLLAVPSAGWTPVGWAQATPSYRPPAKPPTSPQTSSASPAASSASTAQCASGAAPSGATQVSRGNGTAPAPRGTQPSYSQTSLNLANYAVGGLLTIQITAGGGGATTFELFPPNTTFTASGVPSAQALVTQANVAAGNCTTLTYNFSQAGSYILAATSASGSNTFQYASYVQPSFSGVFSSAPATQPTTTPAAQPTQSASAPPAPTPSATAPGTGMFNGVFSPTPATQPGTSQPAALAPSASAPTAQATSPTGQIQGASQTQTPASPTGSSPTPAQPASPSSANTPTMIQTVTIQNSPGVPDTGGHCIICGLVTGNLTAVEPNLVVCVTPAGGAGGARSCTGVCNPGHDCNAPLQRGVTLASTPAVHVEVLDNDKQGKTTPLAAFDESDATQCTTAQPCSQTVPDPTSADANGTQLSISFGFGTPEGCDTSAALWGQGPVLLASTKILPGVLPAQTVRTGPGCPAGPPGCHGPYTSIEDAMMEDTHPSDALDRTVGGTTEYGYVIVLDPKGGGYYTTPPVKGSASTMSIDDYKSSWSSCQPYYDWALVATVHTHPLNPLNENFTPADFTQAVYAKINKSTGESFSDLLTYYINDLSAQCVPQQGYSVFEKIVMIYVGDRRYRTFEPKAGDCTVPSALRFVQNNGYALNDGQWKTYRDRTVISKDAYPQPSP
jgi:hypothetical protein